MLLIVGIWDTAMSQNLQMDPELTLEKAIKTVRQSTERAVGPTEAAERGQQGKPDHDRRGQDWSTSDGWRNKSLRHHKGGARGTQQPKIQGGDKSGQRKPQSKR